MNLKPSVTPREAWEPINETQWTEDNIRHLLRRASWTARPVDVRRLKAAGLDGSMDYIFKNALYPEPHPVIEDFVNKIDEEISGDEINAAIEWAGAQPRWKDSAAKIQKKSYRDPYVRPIVIAHHNYQRAESGRNANGGANLPQFESRFGQRESWTKYAHEWLKVASSPQNSGFEKINGFLQNILVVNLDSLRNIPDYLAHIHNHQRILRDNTFESYRDIIKRMYKGRGMGYMLDVIGSTKARPNENFAREVQELFVLGVDRGYTEDDIKEACKAFTGYVADPSLNPYAMKKGDQELVLDPAQHNTDRKRVFGRSRDYDGDAIVDLIFEKEEAETYLPNMFSHYFLVENGLPEEYLEPLGREWRENDFNFFWLVETFFKSKLFYDPVFRGQIYKSPFQFYLGLLQDLGLQVEPTIEIVRELDYLGQSYSNPPDVNGWDGGAFWMNNGTINSRRIIVDRMFTGDYRRGMKGTTGTTGAENYTVSDDTIRQFITAGGKSSVEVVTHFITYLLPFDPGTAFTTPLFDHYNAAEDDDAKVTALKNVILAILQSQYYQIC